MKLFAWLLAAGMAAVVMGPPGEFDVFSRPVAGEVAGRPRLVLFASKETREQIDQPAMELAARLHDVPFVTVVRVDLRGVPGLFHGIAFSRLRDSHARYTQRTREVYRRLGVGDGAHVADRLVLVGDADGTSHRRVGLERGFQQPMAVVEDAFGREVARGYFPRDLELIERALRRQVTGPPSF